MCQLVEDAFSPVLFPGKSKKCKSTRRTRAALDEMSDPFLFVSEPRTKLLHYKYNSKCKLHLFLKRIKLHHHIFCESQHITHTIPNLYFHIYCRFALMLRLSELSWRIVCNSDLATTTATIIQNIPALAMPQLKTISVFFLYMWVGVCVAECCT